MRRTSIVLAATLFASCQGTTAIGGPDAAIVTLSADSGGPTDAGSAIDANLEGSCLHQGCRNAADCNAYSQCRFFGDVPDGATLEQDCQKATSSYSLSVCYRGTCNFFQCDAFRVSSDAGQDASSDAGEGDSGDGG